MVLCEEFTKFLQGSHPDQLRHIMLVKFGSDHPDILLKRSFCLHWQMKSNLTDFMHMAKAVPLWDKVIFHAAY